MAQGLNEEKIGRLRAYRDDASFTGRERLTLEYAELMALEHTAIGDAFFRRLREELTDAEIVELTMAIGQYIGFGRFYTSWRWYGPSVTSKRQRGRGVAMGELMRVVEHRKERGRSADVPPTPPVSLMRRDNTSGRRSEGAR
jgi:hypothetical protein